MENASPRIDAIIVGAGAAGLGAARRLSAAGLRLLILEARERVGGRINTLHDPAWPVAIERGAEFIHGRPPETWEIIRAAALPAYEFANVQFQHRTDGIVRRHDFWKQIDSVFSRLRGLEEDASFADFVASHCRDVSTDAKQLASTYVEGLNAADENIISAKSLAPPDDGSQEQANELFRLPGGQDSIIHWLHAGIRPEFAEFRFNTVVTNIAWRPGRVTVHTRSTLGPWKETFQADRAIITLPLGVLAAPPDSHAGLSFEPELPSLREAVSQLRMGPVVKVLLKFQHAFWECKELEELGFLYGEQQPFSPWWTMRPMRVPILTGWAGGPAAERLSDLGDAQIVEQALVSLAKIFGINERDLQGLLQAFHVCNWQRDPYSLGAYSYIAAGGIDAPQRLAAPIENTLFFAGEATDAERIGTVAGALASGYRAAQDILQ